MCVCVCVCVCVCGVCVCVVCVWCVCVCVCVCMFEIDTGYAGRTSGVKTFHTLPGNSYTLYYPLQFPTFGTDVHCHRCHWLQQSTRFPAGCLVV